MKCTLVQWISLLFFLEVSVPNDVQVARMLTDRKRRHYVSLYEGSFIPYQHLQLHSVIGEGRAALNTVT